MTEIKQSIPARLKNMAVGGHVAGADDIIDDTLGKELNVINLETIENINAERVRAEGAEQEIYNYIDETKEEWSDVDLRMAQMQATINAKQLEVGAVQTDEVPTENSANHMTSGDIYQTLKNSTKGFVDDVPTAGSNNLVKSGGVAEKSALPLLKMGSFGYAQKSQPIITPNKGYYVYNTGVWTADNTRRSSDLIDVYPGVKLKVTGAISSTYTALIVGFDGSGNYADWYFKRGTGTYIYYEDEYVEIPQGVYKISICTNIYSISAFEYKQYEYIPNVYLKNEAATPADITISISENNAEIVKDFNSLTKDIFTEETINLVNIGGYYRTNGVFTSDSDSGRGVKIIPYNKFSAYEVNTYLSTTAIAALIYTSDSNVTAGENITTVLGYEKLGSGTSELVSDYTPNIPLGTTYIIVQSATLIVAGSVKVSNGNLNIFTKEQSDERYLYINDGYGIKWSISDSDDLGIRVGKAVGKNATIGIGNTDGSSDFDNIYPWSEIKRCNVKTNANGAKIVTFEGESGFALDGSNGDVFVRIPKFKVEKYIKDGYEYRLVESDNGFIHPAFVEEGKELDEIFVGAFEASVVSNIMYSTGGVIPSSNMTPSEFLASAQARGDNYSMYDMRCVDAIWTLMVVEFGCRNTNRIIGYGIADFLQPVQNGLCNVTVAAQSTNSVTLGIPGTDRARINVLDRLAVGGNICICDGDQTNIIARRKIIAVTCASLGDNIVVTFDGDPIDVTLSCFAGNAPFKTNYCESIGNYGTSYALSWHTGRANRVPTYIDADEYNPCRYRWIENPVGNVWHFLPDVSFNGLQMYICKNMKGYVMHKINSPYIPVGNLLPEQTSNNDGSWISSLFNDCFAKGVLFGNAISSELDSTKAFGGFYYLNANNVIIANGGGFDHVKRCNMLTQRAWIDSTTKWYLYGARLIYKNL